MNNERDFNSVMNRLKSVANAVSYNALAEMLNLSSSAFANYKKRNSIPYERIIELSDSLNVSIDWVLTGKGGMYREEQRKNPISDRRTEALIGIYQDLSDADQKEILADIENKKRMNELVETVNQLRKKVG